MKETVGDIDIAVGTDSPREVIEHFASYPYSERIIEKGPATASLLASGGRQVDLMTVPTKTYGSLLQHFTGSKNHNIKLREYALKKGLSLSEKGIKRKVMGKSITDTLETEEAFYKALGMQWIPPEIREDTGEIEAALEGKLPKLITLEDIKGDFHIHSSYPIEPSHDLGENTMEEMFAKAKQLGYEYLGISEHNPSISKHTKKQVYDIMEKRKDKIEQLKLSTKGIRVINLLELDILPNGDLAIDETALEHVDAVLISVHSVFTMDKKSMTKRVLTGLAHPKAKVLCHPTGRLLNQRIGYELDWDLLFDFCKKHNKALEINAWPLRLDLPDIAVREAVKEGVKFVINTDSHSLPEMDIMKYGVSVARRGWAEKHDIINTLSYEDILHWMQS
jgi:DNA polymerase (family 10)